MIKLLLTFLRHSQRTQPIIPKLTLISKRTTLISLWSGRQQWQRNPTEALTEIHVYTSQLVV